MSDDKRRWIDYVPLSELRRAEVNPKRHDEKLISASLDRFGYVEAIAVDERTGRLVAGHGRLDQLEAAHERSEPPPDGVEDDGAGDWLIPVQRGWSSADDDEAAAYLIVSNRAVERGGWETTDLAAMLTELEASAKGLAGIGYDRADLDELRARIAIETKSRPKGDPDHAPPLPKGPAQAKPGDLWVLGNSTLVCGDARDPAVIARALGDQAPDMVWTDPPYGVDYEGKTADKLQIDGDARNLADLHDLLLVALGNAVAACKPGAAFYVAGPAGPNTLIFGTVLTKLGVWRQTLVWVKDRFVLGHSDYHYAHELIFEGVADPPLGIPAPETEPPESIFYGWAPGAAHRPPPDRAQDTVWEVARPAASREHPTMKPVELVARAIRNSTRLGALVLDPFAGSGTTLIAAAAEGRRAACVELDPGYVDVICQRFTEWSGVPAVNFETGLPHP